MTTNVPTTVTGLALFASIATFGGAVFGYSVGWSSYAADYTRRQPVDTPSRRVFLYAFLGVAIPCVLLEILGLLLTTSLAATATLPAAGALIASNIAGSPIAGLVLLLLAFSTIANNVPNDYSFALSSQVLGISIRRWILTIIGALIYLGVAFALQANFNLNLEGFLLLIAYWLGSWGTIVLIEHLMRRGNYPVGDYQNGKLLPVGIAAVTALILGLGIAAFGINQASTIGFEGPLAHKLGDADIGFPLAILATGIIYLVLRRWELSRFKR